MNATQSLFAAIVLTAAAGSAFAQEFMPAPATSTGAVGRAEVVAQAADVARQGSLRDNYDSRPVVQAKASGLSREAVRAEARAALASGEIARNTAQIYNPAPVAAAADRLAVSAKR